MKTLAIPLFAGILFFSCASSTPGTKPDDMSAEAHEREAKKHDAEAAKQAAQYDPNAVTWRTAGSIDSADLALPDYYYNPTEEHRTLARMHEEHAKAHRAAAATLESFEQKECVGFKESQRALCPLLGAVTSVEDVDGGVRFTIADGIDPEGLIAHMRCHFAAGRTAGREGMPQCPLYLKEVRVQQMDEHTLKLTSSVAEEVPELRQRMRDHIVSEN